MPSDSLPSALVSALRIICRNVSRPSRWTAKIRGAEKRDIEQDAAKQSMVTEAKGYAERMFTSVENPYNTLMVTRSSSRILSRRNTCCCPHGC